ncbi:MAG: hypothetical protein QM763_19915 [Agriterribacter sp.]
MKHVISLSFLCLVISSLCFAQNDTTTKVWKSPFKKGYLRLGINTVGKKLNNTLSPKDNVMQGNLGAGIGFVFEAGHIFYFLKKTPGRKINVGLDWTIISLTYNEARKKWENYAIANGQSDAAIVGIIPKSGGDDKKTSPLIASISTKLGPTVAFNVVEKLVIEVRAQVSAGINSYLMQYEDDNYIFETIDESRDAKPSDLLLPSIKPNVGITVRRGRLGLAFDYSPGKANMSYSFGDDRNDTYGKMKVPFNSIQLKFNF